MFEVGENYVTPDSDVLFAVLLILSSSAGQAVARDDLLQLLWPESTPVSARHRLRQALYQLRKLGAPLKNADSVLNLRKTDVEIDYIACERDRHLLAASVSESSRLEILPHYAPTFSVPFAKWVESERDRVRAMVRRRLLDVLAEKRARGNHEEVITLARACLDLDRHNGEATCALAEALAVRGNRVEALAVIDQYEEESVDGPADTMRPTTALRRRIVEAAKRAAQESVRPPELVGRSELVHEMMTWLSTPSNDAKVFALSGEAGIGKTRLLLEAVQAASVQGMRVLEYRPAANGKELAVASLLDLLPRLLELPGAVGCAPDSYRRLTELARGASFGDPEASEAIDSAIQFAILRRSVVDLFEAVLTECRVLLVIDDAHDLDVPTLEILLHVTRQCGPRARLLIAFRSVGSAATVLCSRSEVRLSRVGGLDDASARKIVTRLMSSEVAAQRSHLVDWAIDLASGNPFFLVELSAHCSRDNPGEALPTSLQIALERKLDALSPSARLLIQACAVLSRNSTLARIEDVLSLAPHAMAVALAELELCGLTIRVDNRVLCRHDLIAEAVVNGLGASVGAYLHRRCAATLHEELNKSPTPSLAWECARHWAAAGEDSRALELTNLIGDQLLALGLPNAAAELLESSERYCTTVEQRAERLLRLSVARRRQYDWDGVIAALDQRSAILKERTDGTRNEFNSDEIALFEAKWWRFSDTQALSCAVARVGSALAPTYHRLQMAVLGLIVADNQLRPKEAKRIYRAAQAIEPTTVFEELERSRADVVYHLPYGDIDIAVSAARRVVETGRLTPNSTASIRNLRWLSATLVHANDVGSAKLLLQDAFHLASRLQVSGEQWYTAMRMAQLALDSDDVDTATEWVETCSRLESESPAYAVKNFDFIHLTARAALAQQDNMRARSILAAAEARRHTILPPRGQHSILAIRVLAAVNCNALVSQRSLSALQRLHNQALGYGLRDFETAALVAGLTSVGDQPRARGLLDEYIGVRRTRLPYHSALREAARRLGCQLNDGSQPHPRVLGLKRPRAAKYLRGG